MNKNNNAWYRFILCIPLFLFPSLFAQEALVSDFEQYYDFLALDGITVRPSLNYRTLSDSQWVIPEGVDTLWQNHLPKTYTLYGDAEINAFTAITMRIYGPELFTSFNSAAPYGQNDGALWQGKGFNTALTGGVRFELFGIEATLKPQIVLSQNLPFDLISQTYYNSEYAYFWGYGKNAGVDAPQRFGNDSFFDFSWGDSEIRYTWKTLTIGFGTQSPWIGPAQINPILHSNNAPPYPKLDIGLRRQPVRLFDWYAGDVEARLWAGYLTESKYFDSDKSNDHNLITGLSVAYAPSFLPGLTVSMNRVFQAAWEKENFKYILELISINSNKVNTNENQMMSFSALYFLPSAGVEFYGEIGIDDYIDAYIQYPFHTMVYTVGFKKNITMFPVQRVFGQLQFEWTSLEMSQDFQFQWPYSFYMHHLITQGYTNGGQWLGAGNGTGGNSQYLGYTVYYPKGKSHIYIHRSNPDNNYIYKNSIGTGNTPINPDNSTDENFYRFKALLTFGIQSIYFITDTFSISVGFAKTQIINPTYTLQYEVYPYGIKMNNFRFEFGVKYSF